MGCCKGDDASLKHRHAGYQSGEILLDGFGRGIVPTKSCTWAAKLLGYVLENSGKPFIDAGLIGEARPELGLPTYGGTWAGMYPAQRYESLHLTLISSPNSNWIILENVSGVKRGKVGSWTSND